MANCFGIVTTVSPTEVWLGPDTKKLAEVGVTSNRSSPWVTASSTQSLRMEILSGAGMSVTSTDAVWKVQERGKVQKPWAGVGETSSLCSLEGRASSTRSRIPGISGGIATRISCQVFTNGKVRTLSAMVGRASKRSSLQEKE